MNHESDKKIWRVVVVSDGPADDPSTNSGVARGMVSALRRRSDVQLAALIDSTPSRALKALNAVLSFRFKRVEWRNNFRKGPFSTWARSRTRDSELTRLRERPDVVLHIRNTYLPAADPYASFLDGTATLSQNGWAGWRLPARSQTRRIADERRQFDGAIAVYTAGLHVAQEVIDTYGQPAEKVKAVGGGINFALTQGYTDGRRAAQYPQSILFVGKDFSRKGGEVLMQAFARLRENFPDLFLTIVGPASLEPRYSEMDGVRFLGPISDRSRMSQLYEEADIFCLPSIFEPYGLVVQEAMAHGAVCVVSDVGALPEMVGYGSSGVVSKAGDADALFLALSTLVSDLPLRRRLALAAWQQLPEFTWDRVADRLMDHLSDILASSEPASRDSFGK